MDTISLILSVVKIVVVMAWVYALLRVMGHASKWVKIGGIIALFVIIQIAISFPIDAPIMKESTGCSDGDAT